MLPVVVLVGRPNVGKSTLFNALTRSREALVADVEGVTRDRRYGVAHFPEQSFIVVDTGGLTQGASGIEALTVRQAEAAIEEADALLFMVDARDGITSDDREFAQRLRATGKPIILVINKTDGLDEHQAEADFSELGLPESSAIAAVQRRGVIRLAEKIALLPLAGSAAGEAEQQLSGPRVTVVGRPNVGKSTLINRLLGDERLLAFDQPGTTRDSIAVPWAIDGEDYVLIDTAGVRRRSKVSETVEKFSVIKALQAIEQSEVVVVVIDARDGVVDQDTTILGAVLKAGKALVIAVNKWDGLSGGERQEVVRSLERKLRFVSFAQQCFISALHGSGLGDLVNAIRRAWRSSRVEVSSHQLSELLAQAVAGHSPPMVNGRTAKPRYAHLGGHSPLRVIIHGNRLEALPDSYIRYLSNWFREQLELVGVPVWVERRTGKNPFADKRNILTPRQLAKRKRLKKFVRRKGR